MPGEQSAPDLPGGVDLAATAALVLSHDTLTDRGDHVVAGADQVAFGGHRRVAGPGLRERGQVLGIEVHNVGRAPLVVTRYEAVMEPKSLSLAPVADAFEFTLPHSMAPGDSAQWWVRMDEVRATAHAATGAVVEQVTGAHMKVTTALRKETRTMTSIRLA